MYFKSPHLCKETLAHQFSTYLSALTVFLLSNMMHGLHTLSRPLSKHLPRLSSDSPVLKKEKLSKKLNHGFLELCSDLLLTSDNIFYVALLQVIAYNMFFISEYLYSAG
jgi:hypothetical protein